MNKVEKKNIKTLILACLLVVSLILIIDYVSSAETTSKTFFNLGEYKQGDCVRIIERCTFGCSYVTITSILSNTENNSLIDNSGISMSSIDTYFWYYDFCNTTSLNGVYTFLVGGQDGTMYMTDVFTIKVKPRGWDLSLGGILVYLFFLFLTLSLMFFSIKLIKYHPFTEDMIFTESNYKEREENKMKFYIKLLKSKLYILGLFGFYLCGMLFLSFFNQLSYTVGIVELGDLLSSLVIILGWGLIPFILFWVGYMIVYFYLSTERILKYQFGGWGRLNDERK